MFGNITDNGATVWYPGDADAGMVARESFYMAVRYDGTEANTLDLELTGGNPAAHHDATSIRRSKPHDRMELRSPARCFRAQSKPDHLHQLSHMTRNPFTDHPEWVWSIFVNQTNNSQIADFRRLGRRRWELVEER